MEIPRPLWMQALKSRGFSEKAAESFAAMTALALDAQATKPKAPPERGATSLQSYVQKSVGLGK